MRNCEQDFNDTCQLMRQYMQKIQPQRFLSLWSLYQKQKQICERNGIPIPDTSDIADYANQEHIERFGF